MPFIDTPFRDLKIFEPQVWGDERGYFYESYNFKTFAAAGIDCVFVQDNQSKSSKNVLRGLHYQTGTNGQAKLVRVLKGAVLDVVVDMRDGSPTFGQSFSIELSAENKKQLFVPRGFAHGFTVLSEEAIFAYKCDNYYSKAHEGGVLFNDPKLGIDWKIDLNQVQISGRDQELPLLGNHLPVNISF